MRRLSPLILVALVACNNPTPSDLPEVDAGVESDTGEDATIDYVEGHEALEHVNPFIGTGGSGFAYAGMTPAAQTPLGFVKVGPDTTRGGTHPSAFHHFSGYYWRDPDIRGFSHLHFVGTGTADYGNLRVSVGNERKLDRLPVKWWTAKVEGSEVAEPGYYRVDLADGTTAEMTAMSHAAMHRYAMDGNALLAIDPSSSVNDEGALETEVTIDGDTVEGRVLYAGSYVGRGRPFELFFSARVTPRPTRAWVWNDDGYQRDATDASGETAGAILGWGPDDERRVTLEVGVSLISRERAREHLADVDPLSFDEVRTRARDEWASLLGRVEIPDGEQRQLRLFYTALYNCFRMPTRLDENGEYRGIDGEVHSVDHRYFTDLSLWDTYRTLHPLWTLIAPDLQRDALRSLLLMGRDGGYIPRWPAGLSYTGGMEGDSAAMLFAEGALKGIDGVDYEDAFDLLLKTANGAPPPGAPYSGRSGIESYLELGWVAADESSGGASNTLEYAINDAALAELAAFLGREEEAAFRARAKSYQNVWDDDEAFFRPRNRDGSWVEPFAPNVFHERSGDFTEGTARHWRYYVPHDPDGLVELFGGPERFTAELQTFMSESRLWEGDPSLLIIPDPYYWHTNQPPLHAPFLFAAVDEWDQLEQWVTRILENAYFDRPDGLVGNDDGGTLSSWYVLASLGVYPVVGTDRWVVFTPQFDQVRIDGEVVEWHRDEPRYVDHASLID
jgi:predicted alpha-1,2-mannosidase